MNSVHLLRRHVRLVIRQPYLGVSREAVCQALDLGGKLWEQAKAKGITQNAVRYDLNKFDPDKPKTAKRAISIATEPRFEDRFNRLENWRTTISAEERKYRAARLEELRDREKEILDKGEGDRSDDEKDELLNLQRWIKQLEVSNQSVKDAIAGRTPGPGYLASIPNGFGDNTNTLYYSLNEPNIPTAHTSNFYIEEDTAHAVRLFFWKPNEEQTDWQWSYQFGYYRLIFEEHGIEFVRLNNKFSLAQIEAKEKQLETLMDLGRITRSDTIWKADKKKEIAAIKTAAKNAKKDLTSAQKQKIKAIEKEIDDRWEAKRRRTPAQDDQIERLRKEVFKHSERVEFGQNFESFFNQTVVLSFFPQRRGYVTIQLQGAQSWSYEEREIQKTRVQGTLWKRTQIKVRSNGGAYKFQVGNVEPKAEIARYPIGPYEFPFDPTALPFTISGNGEFGGGSSIEWEFVPVNSTDPWATRPTPGVRAAWQLNAILKPAPLPPVVPGVLNGRRIPWIYDGLLFIPPGPRTGTDDVQWDSEDHLTDGEAPVEEISLNYDEAGSLSCNVTLPDIEGGLELPPDIDGCLADLYIGDTDDVDVPFLARGIIHSTKFGNRMEAAEGASALPEGKVTFTLSDRRYLLRETVRTRPVGDGQHLGQHVKTMLICRGEKPAEVALIDEDYGPVLEAAGLGEEPAQRPAQGSTYSGYMDDVLETSGIVGDANYQLLWVSDATGGHWELGSPSQDVAHIRDETGSLQLAEFFSSDEYEGRFKIKRGKEISLPDNSEEVYNEFHVEGDINKEEDARIEATWPVWESISKPSDLRYVGRPRPYRTVRLESIKTKDGAMRAAFSLSKKHCKSRKLRHLPVPFLEDLKPGMVIEAEGLKCELVKLDDNSLHNDEMSWVARRLE